LISSFSPLAVAPVCQINLCRKSFIR